MRQGVVQPVLGEIREVANEETRPQSSPSLLSK